MASRISADQYHEIETLITQAGADKARFCRYFKIAGVAELPTARFDEAKKALERKRDEN